MENTPNSTQEEVKARKLQEISDELDKEEEPEKFCLEEEKVEEMMQELYKEITFNHEAKNESCGELISDSKSSTMAGMKVVSSSRKFAETRNRLATVAMTEKGDSIKTLFRIREEKNERRKKLFNDEDHLDCEWVGRILQNWWF
ncbi:hypothetical protein LR48_Vigan07g257400 [Vigna angularis]|uniref:Uncharacterized protein n=1 Tax=Phaseolus angularis TaxID=3914 RepID=A0A0L9V162_PHAAN|nr:uncharacterized protein HKW66_Vig0223630 [Vigna angularis]KOM48870.1 hypothetical protein LR48_Vigan07g257400 [Vigna angularis]